MSEEERNLETLAAPMDAKRERRAVSGVGFVFLLSMAAGVAWMVIYAIGAQTQLEGVLLFVMFGGIGLGLIMWGKYLFPPEIVTDERGSHIAEQEVLDAAEESYAQGEEQVARRSFLIQMLMGAVGVLGVALLFPVRSLGPRPGSALFITAWRAGLRLVDETGRPLKASDIAVGGMATVLPEGHLDAVDSVAIVVRVQPELLHLPDGRNAWAPDGLVCYSKICTHLGCAVGLYLKQFHELQCPCHFSAFDILDGAQPVFGPAARPLPQLPIEIDPQGYLVAKGDFPEPVGPGFWNRGSEA